LAALDVIMAEEITPLLRVEIILSSGKKNMLVARASTTMGIYVLPKKGNCTLIRAFHAVKFHALDS
jgi:hypothetical protein